MIPGELMQYYEDGWRTVKLAAVNNVHPPTMALVETCPAYKAPAQHLKLPYGALTPVSPQQVKPLTLTVPPNPFKKGEEMKSEKPVNVTPKASKNGHSIGFVPTYTVSANPKANKAKAAELPLQCQVMLKVIGKKTFAYPDLIAALEKSELKTVQGAARIWAFYKSRLVKEHFLVVSEAS